MNHFGAKQTKWIKWVKVEHNDQNVTKCNKMQQNATKQINLNKIEQNE